MSKQKEYYLPEWYKYGARGFQQRINNARNQLDSLLKFFDDEYNFLWSESCRYWSANDAWDRYTPVVIKKISTYLQQGFGLKTAMKIVAFQCDHKYNEVFNIWHNHLKDDELKKYATKFLIFTLKNAGFKVADISRIAQKSRKYVYDILKEDFIL